MNVDSIKELLFRASLIQDIMSGGNEITATQLKELDELQYKLDNPVPLTEAQWTKLAELEGKLKNPPPLSKSNSEKLEKLTNINLQRDLTDKEQKSFDDLVEKKNTLVPLSATQQKQYDDLVAKRDAKTGSLTEKQQEKLDELIAKRDAKPELPAGVKMFCVRMLSENYYKRREHVESKYLKKGLGVEEDSITLLSLIDGVFYMKNDLRLTNDWFTGEFDLSDAEDPKEINLITDIKSSYTLHTFLRSKFEPHIDSRYYGQLQIYMDLTGARKAQLAYCLVNSPVETLLDEKKALQWKMGVSDETIDYPKEYIRRLLDIEKNHVFDMALFKKRYPGHTTFHDEFGYEWDYDIPMEERVHKIPVEYDEEYIKKAKERVEMCREYILTTLIPKLKANN